MPSIINDSIFKLERAYPVCLRLGQASAFFSTIAFINYSNYGVASSSLNCISSFHPQTLIALGAGMTLTITILAGCLKRRSLLHSQIPIIIEKPQVIRAADFRTQLISKKNVEEISFWIQVFLNMKIEEITFSISNLEGKFLIFNHQKQVWLRYIAPSECPNIPSDVKFIQRHEVRGIPLLKITPIVSDYAIVLEAGKVKDPENLLRKLIFQDNSTKTKFLENQMWLLSVVGQLQLNEKIQWEEVFFPSRLIGKWLIFRDNLGIHIHHSQNVKDDLLLVAGKNGILQDVSVKFLPIMIRYADVRIASIFNDHSKHLRPLLKKFSQQKNKKWASLESELIPGIILVFMKHGEIWLDYVRKDSILYQKIKLNREKK